MVARTLEKQWEAKQRACEALELEFQMWQSEKQPQLSEKERESLMALATDLPTLWQADTTTMIDRKDIIRLVLKEVMVDQHRMKGQVYFKLIWQTGANTEHHYQRAVLSYKEHAQWSALAMRLQQLHTQAMIDKDIAKSLNEEGFKTARGLPFNSKLVWLLRKKLGLVASVQSKMEAV